LAAANNTRASIAKRVLAAMHLLVRAGLRVSDVVDLQVDDVVFDYPGVHLTVRDSRGRGTRDIPLPPDVCTTLKEYLVIKPKSRASNCLFLTQEGNPLSSRTVQRIVNRCAKAANLTGITAQILRRTYAMNLLDEVGDIDLVSHRLGHQSISVTYRYLSLENGSKG
jgi:site-specific recombinase XerD